MHRLLVILAWPLVWTVARGLNALEAWGRGLATPHGTAPKPENLPEARVVTLTARSRD